MDTCIKVPNNGFVAHVFCGKDITDDDLVPVDIQTGVIQSIAPVDYREICQSCRNAIAKSLLG